ncbi:hypothetical protein MPH_09661 [Macrophomina phaseolina MS6]|uniref:Uncharacterized protein n=2 Tax=Macrophomina phaseolina TaxID=35725 RepID=K2RSI2_MACPH|nr:hypothetical protein MPH_09661 [Macrophomina phaseolina MS6]KAH7034300.1 hypothetical protein B0J12DRAFT_703672 [Macrophomina phaseolina]
MKFFAAAAAALSVLSMGVFAAPTASEAGVYNGLEARSGEVTVCSVLTDLHAQIQIHTGRINATYVGQSQSALSQIQKTTCVSTVKVELSAIADIVTSATTKLHGCSKAGAENDVIISLIVKIVFEIVCTINGVVAYLGASALLLLNFTINLVINVLGSLLLAVEGIVAGVLAVAWGLVSGVLGLVLPGVGSLFIGLGNTLHGECGCVSQ